MHIVYLDEFGHNGHYCSRDHSSYKTHPVFGIGGFSIPSDNVRQLSRSFRFLKEQALKEEIEAKVKSAGKRVEHWEKKGSALLTTRNIKRYEETRRLIFRVLNLLERLGARIVFYGQEKERGGPDQVPETASDRYGHSMRQLITRIQGDLPGNENFMLILDKQGNRERMDIFAQTASFMFSNQNATRLLEPPMEVESHLYQTVQCADWICALLGRITAYKYDPGFEEFEWAPRYFGERLASITSPSSKILGSSKGSLDIFKQHLHSTKPCYNPTNVPATIDSLEKLSSRLNN